MSQAQGLNKGLGYSFRYVLDVLNGNRRNASIIALHKELVALRTPRKRQKS